MNDILSPDEKMVMEQTFKASFIRAAAVIEKITQDDVLDMQARLLSEGVPLEKVARVDRLDCAVAYLKAIAAGQGRAE